MANAQTVLWGLQREGTSFNTFHLQPSVSWVVPGKQRLPTTWSQSTIRSLISWCSLFFPTNQEGLRLFQWLATAKKGRSCFHPLPASAACTCPQLAVAYWVLRWAESSPWLSRGLMWQVSPASGTEERQTHAGEGRRRKRRQRRRSGVTPASVTSTLWQFSRAVKTCLFPGFFYF